MIERRFVAQKTKEFLIQEYIEQNLKRVGHSHTKLIKTPLGEKIIVYASRPGLIVGKRGENIRRLTNTIKKRFELENPQIEINEIEDINLDAKIVAETIANSLERYGISKFKAIGHRTMADVLNAGALGIEILISGKVPSARAKRWRFYKGYLKKSGDISQEGIKKAYSVAQLKSGTVGIQVRITPPDIKLPDKVELKKLQEEEKPSATAKEEKEGEKEIQGEKEKKTEKDKEKKKEGKKEKPRKKKDGNTEKEGNKGN